MAESQKRERRSTIKDVAAAAAVSISTVSLVMNGKKNVSPETRERVLEAALRLGYVPQQAARQLASQRTGNIGFVLREDHFRRSEPFYTRIFLGTEFEARNHSVYVLLTTIPEAYEPRVHTPRFLLEQNVDGLLVAGKVDDAFIEEVGALDLPVVLIDFEAAGYSSVTIDNQNGARMAVEHLLERGHEQIAFVGADMAHPSLQARLEGYQLALGAAGLRFEPEAIVVTDGEEPTRITGRRLGETLFDGHRSFSAAFCVNDAVALGLLDLARTRGLAVPDDLAVVGFDDVEGAAHAVPPLSTVRVAKEQLGELALRYLAELIEEVPENHDRYLRRRHKVKVPAELVVRGSS